MIIKSDTVELNNSPEDVFTFITDFNNFEKLVPQDKVSDWSSTSEECSFTITGLAKVGMKIKDKKPFSEVNIISHGKNPFDFTLDIFIEEAAAEKSRAYLIFQADVNPFMKMMLEKPLGNFFNMMAQRLKETKG